MARECFRNTELEDYHAGMFPSSKAGDYSDVKVVSPFGKIFAPSLLSPHQGSFWRRDFFEMISTSEFDCMGLHTLQRRGASS
jgi:hypothetical protein